MTTDALGANAVAYAAKGWPVFPIKPRAKVPLTAHGFKDATTDTQKVREWWSRWPDANVALPTGHAFDVLDIDGDEGVEELGRVLREVNGHDDEKRWILPAGPVAYTPNDGVHVYVAPTGNGNRTAMRPGIDYRGQGGYVLAPPSIGANGCEYRWWTIEDDYDLDHFPAAPTWLLDLLNPAQPSPAPLPSLRSRPIGISYAESALIDECAAVSRASTGTRNDTLNRAAFNVGQLVATGLLDAAVVFGALLDAALRVGLADGEARATIKSGLSNGIANPRRVAS